MTLRGTVRVSIEDYDTMRFMATAAKPQATLERAMSHISKRERDLGPALGDALAILNRAHNRVMNDRRQKEAA